MRGRGVAFAGKRGMPGRAEVGAVAWGGRMDGLGRADGMQHAVYR